MISLFKNVRISSYGCVPIIKTNKYQNNIEFNVKEVVKELKVFERDKIALDKILEIATYIQTSSVSC